MSEKERCSLASKALIFFFSCSLLWTPDLLLMVFEGAIQISFILPV